MSLVVLPLGVGGLPKSPLVFQGILFQEIGRLVGVRDWMPKLTPVTPRDPAHNDIEPREGP